MSNQVITRFAPSPTGYLHIGGARTALFNWLYAKANNGKMLLRIEDTDQARSTTEAVEAIKEGLLWLGLEWDGEAISQHSRVERHRAIAHEMVENGSAYKCICTPEKLTEMREKAAAEGRQPCYDGTCREKAPASMPSDTPYVIRLKTPKDGDTIVEDEVQGDVRFPNAGLDDLILLRSDTNPTYMLAVVVDDHDMGVTHIIRGDDHLTNAAKQVLILKGMGWDIPVMAHIPLIHGADGAKLSKRHGAIGAEKYRAMGYLPEGLRNYLVKLGWAHGDDEIMSEEQLLEWFDFKGMNKAAARFDFTKLDSINGHYIRNGDDEMLVGALLEILDELDNVDVIKQNLNMKTREKLVTAMPSLKERAKTLVSLAEGAKFLFETHPLNMEEKAAKHLDENGLAVIVGILPDLQALSPWEPETIDACVRGYAEKHELKLGKVAQPLRAALTGKATSVGAFDVLNILGKDESIARLSDCV